MATKKSPAKLPKPDGGKKKNKSGTADTMARRLSQPWSGADSQGIRSKNTGTWSGRPSQTPRPFTEPSVYYHTVGSSNKKINDGKRFTSNKEMKGVNKLVMETSPGVNGVVWGEYNEKITASDAIVKPRIVKKTAGKKTGSAGPKKKMGKK
jgi:hypothetical protein